MNQQEMFEKSFERPTNYFQLSEREQWAIDSDLGILDWKGESLSPEEIVRYLKYYEYEGE